MSQGISILPREFRRLAGERGEATALRQKELGIWQSCSWRELACGIDEVAAGLLELGVQPGEVVGIVSSPCRDWVLADFGGQSAGVVVAGLHTTDTTAAIVSHLRSLAVRVIFVEDDALFEAIGQAGELPLLEHVVAFRTEGLRRATDPRLQSLQQLRERGAQALSGEPKLVESAIDSRGDKDDAIIVSSTGTTGGTRAIRLSHASVHSACRATSSALAQAAAGKGERMLFLPLSHAVERVGVLYTALLDGSVVNFVEGQDTVFDNLCEVQPAVLQAVPRFWERLRSNLVLALNEATRVEQWMYRTALRLGERCRPEGASSPPVTTRWAHKALDLVVLANLRRLMGLDRLRMGIVVGAPASTEMIRWFRSLGIDLRVAWSSAELGGYVCLGGPDDPSEAVGRALPGYEVRVGEQDELFARPAVPDAPWHPTGDIGSIDSSGRVHVNGRMADLIVTANTQEVQPAQLERLIKSSPYISDAIVVGRERPHLACLVVLNRDSVEQWAQKRQVPFSDLSSLCESAEVRDLIAGEVSRTVAAQSHAVRAVKLIDVAADGDPRMYTPALTLKRKAVMERFAPAVELMYRSASV